MGRTLRFIALLGCVAVLLGGCGEDPVCGDGVLGGIEQCDDGNTVDADACTNACRLPRCGDGIADIHGYR